MNLSTALEGFFITRTAEGYSPGNLIPSLIIKKPRIQNKWLTRGSWPAQYPSSSPVVHSAVPSRNRPVVLNRPYTRGRFADQSSEHQSFAYNSPYALLPLPSRIRRQVEARHIT